MQGSALPESLMNNDNQVGSTVLENYVQGDQLDWVNK